MVPKGETKKRIPEYEYSPLTFSIETKGGISTPLIRRGTPLPSKRNQIFSTAEDNQKSVEIHVLIGERPLAKYNVSFGRCLLSNIPPAKLGTPQIRVTFDVYKSCDISIETLETKSGVKVEANFKSSQIKLNDTLIQKLISDAKYHKTRDEAELVMAEAELRVQKDQKNDIITSTTKKIEQLISELGIALMEDEFFIDAKTQTLRKLLDRSSDASTNLGYGDFGSVFESLFPTTPSVKQRKPPSVQTTSQSQEQKSKESNIPANTPSTHITALVQGFLEQISPDLEIKRSGAWQALDSGTQDGPSQAVHSMREVLRQMLDILAPATKIQEASWYKKPKDGPLVTRSMKIRYALTGTANVKSESTLSLINGMAETINSMYAKLSAESHSNTRSKISSVRMYLNACESLIGLIVTERKV